MRLGAKVGARFAPGLLGAFLGWPFCEKGGLMLAGALLRFEQAGPAVDLGFQFDSAALQRLTTETSWFVHAGKMAKCPARSCASARITSAP
jgi:hypothetical protein